MIAGLRHRRRRGCSGNLRCLGPGDSKRRPQADLDLEVIPFPLAGEPWTRVKLLPQIPVIRENRAHRAEQPP